MHPHKRMGFVFFSLSLGRTLRAMEWERFAAALRAREDRSLPAAIVDLDAFERNIDRVRSSVTGTGKTVRVASKSVRHVGLLRRIMERGGESFAGLMCFTMREACFLSDAGFDDLLVAYPSVEPTGLRAVAERVARGATIRLMADHAEHLDAYDRAGVERGVTIEILVELDMAYRPLDAVALGVLRSPLHRPAQIAKLARRAATLEGVRVVGLMGYEAHIAGLPDATPFSRALNPARRALKALALGQVAERRAEGRAALERAGIEVHVINGGGTGSLASTPLEDAVTEVTAGSAFLCPHLFDYYAANPFEPAGFFALEVSRIPKPGVVTCLGGGYIASGEAGADRLPRPWLPRGLELVAMEGAGEVQTPLKAPRDLSLAIGDPVIFRHAKAGELAERFESYLLLRGETIVASEPTYRGQGGCFL